jgi:hypothetical protein
MRVKDLITKLSALNPELPIYTKTHPAICKLPIVQEVKEEEVYSYRNMDYLTYKTIGYVLQVEEE